MTIETHNSEEFRRAMAAAAVRGQRVLSMKRGKTNAAWVLEVTEPDRKPDLPLWTFAETKNQHAA